MKRIAFYVNHKEDLGHLNRLANIVRAIGLRRKKRCSIIIFQAGPSTKTFRFPSSATVDLLPHPFYTQQHLKTRVSLNPAHLCCRADFLLKKIRRIKPDVFVTAFFPFGCLESRFELAPALTYCKRTGIRILASSPLPYFIHNDHELRDLFYWVKFYDKIMVHAPRGLDLPYLLSHIKEEKRITTETYRAVFDRLDPRITYTGYVVPFLKGSADKTDIVVFRGAGTTSPRLIECFIKAMGLLRNKLKVLIVAGPATTASDFSAFKTLIGSSIHKNRIVLKKYVPNLYDYLRNTRLAIGTAGNTANELLSLGRQSIIVPFKGYPGSERADQGAKADMLRDYLGACVLDYDQLSSQKLADAIGKKINCPPKKLGNNRLKPEWFQGGQKSAKLILSGS